MYRLLEDRAKPTTRDFDKLLREIDGWGRSYSFVIRNQLYLEAVLIISYSPGIDGLNRSILEGSLSLYSAK